MRKLFPFSLVVVLSATTIVYGQTEADRKQEAERAKLVDTRVDNNRYWKLMAERGLATLNPVVSVEPAHYVGSEIRSFSSVTEDSPDVPVASSSSTQSENSIFVDPTDNLRVVNSNNSTPNPVAGIYGANSLVSGDGGETWGGTVQGAGGSNSGDPVALVGLDGTYFIGFISESGGQAIARSTNQGSTYTVYNVANSAGGGLLDKNHMWIDNSPVSPYQGNLYDAWTDFGGPIDNNIGVSRSVNGGMNWSTPVNVSSAVNAGSHCQGVNINSGPDGEVYVIWAIYDGWPTDETAIGMARSFDGGATWQPATRIIQNIRGIRNTGVNKNMRNNAFPAMAVDISGGERNGNIYVVWSNVGVPGVNSGNDVDVYMSRSEDQGETWSVPVRVNQDPIGLGRKHYFPWITCDPEKGILSVVFYDDRNVGGNQCEVYCANSYDGGETWEDFRVSDVSFTPSPIPGLADGYMGDYLGINARGSWVYPTWADNRTGSVMTYVSPYQTNPLSRPRYLTADVEFETGISSLDWNYLEEAGFTHFNIYRDGELIGTAEDTVYSDLLPDYGIYNYRVTAFYEGIGESSPSSASVQWGDAQIRVEPESIYEILMPDSSVTRFISVHNTGQLEMDYELSMFIPTEPLDNNRAYCAAQGGCDEFISRVQLNEIDNSSTCGGYQDFTNLSTTMSVGSTYQITITNGNPIYSTDKCGLWVDWNQNEIFDSNEAIPVNGSPGVGPYTADITPPQGTLAGPTRLRTRIVYFGSPEPCGTSVYGEVEDYTIYVLSWITPDPITGSIPAGESLQIAVELSASDLDLGTYTADINIFSNDPDDPEVTVPVTLVVAGSDINIYPDNDAICLGDSVRLNTEVLGNVTDLTYSWSSLPEGFSSEEANPMVSPDTTTIFYVEIRHTSDTLTNMVTIKVNPLPEIHLGADTVICRGETLELNAGEGFTTYLWSTGDTTMTLSALETGDYWVEVSNEFGCTRRDTLSLLVNDIPDQPLISNGPTSVDNYFNTPSTYGCDELPNALSYAWSIDPEAAGTISGDGTSAQVNWAEGYTGPATVTVVASNDCGISDASASYATTVYTSAGLGEQAESRLTIYPNPGDGRFNVKLPVNMEFRGDILVTDANGAVVQQIKGAIVAAGETYPLNLSTMPAGIYNLSLKAEGKSYSGRLIIQSK